MADTQRTRAEVLTLFADNVTGQISAQDLRDFAVTLMPEDFQFAIDFWTEPKPQFITTDKTGRGWIDYSGIAGSTLLFGDALCYDTSTGMLLRAYCSASNRTPCIGIALDSYTSNASNVMFLRKGIIYNSTLSATWSGQVGRPIYLTSAAGSAGGYSYTPPTAASYPPIIGMICASNTSAFAGCGKFRFDPNWFVVGT